MAALVEGWQMPPTPVETCSECGGAVMPLAFADISEWHLHFGCVEGCFDPAKVPDDKGFIAWPFGRDDRVSSREMRALGFTIV